MNKAKIYIHAKNSIHSGLVKTYEWSIEFKNVAPSKLHKCLFVLLSVNEDDYLFFNIIIRDKFFYKI